MLWLVSATAASGEPASGLPGSGAGPCQPAVVHQSFQSRPPCMKNRCRLCPGTSSTAANEESLSGEPASGPQQCQVPSYQAFEMPPEEKKTFVSVGPPVDAASWPPSSLPGVGMVVGPCQPLGL